ncbi:major capsid protein [Streptomyces sp. NPDC021093]|uniref:major capsid protein n=1 Tax=Streptomyces sp. NPDC021093 TaxID=3365112 RepID=UPI0037A68117
MALTLAESAKFSTAQLQRGVIETFIQASSVLDRIPLLTIEGNAYAYNEEAVLPGVAFRSVGEGYTESTGVVNQKFESLVILGGDADVDTFDVRTRGNVNDLRAVQTAMKVKSAARTFDDTFFNGDVSQNPKSFEGLRKRLAGAQILNANVPVVGNGSTDTLAFFDKLDELVGAVPGLTGGNGAIYTNALVIGKIRAAARRVGGVEQIREDLTRKEVTRYNGIPILDAGQTRTGADILPPTVNGSEMFAVRFGQDEDDQAVTGLTNGGIQVDDLGQLTIKPAYRTRIEFYCGVGVFGGKAAARLTNVLNG